MPSRIESAPSQDIDASTSGKNTEVCSLPETSPKQLSVVPYASAADVQPATDFDYENTTSIQEV